MNRAGLVWILFGVILLLAVIFVVATDPSARENLDVAGIGILSILVIWLLFGGPWMR